MDNESARQYEAVKGDGTKVKMQVRKPTRRERESAGFEYSAVFNRALRAGLPPRVSMLKTLKEQGVVTDEQLNEVENLRMKAGEAEDALSKAGEDDEDRQELSDKRDEAVNAWNEAQSEINAMLEHTADAKAGQSQRNFLVACTTYYAECEENGDRGGNRAWASVDELMDEEDDTLVQREVYEFMMFESNLPSDWPSDEDDSPAEDDKAEAETEAGEAEQPAENGEKAESLPAS